jgi:hypothetical protein
MKRQITSLTPSSSRLHISQSIRKYEQLHLYTAESLLPVETKESISKCFPQLPLELRLLIISRLDGRSKVHVMRVGRSFYHMVYFFFSHTFRIWSKDISILDLNKHLKRYVDFMCRHDIEINESNFNVTHGLLAIDPKDWPSEVDPLQLQYLDLIGRGDVGEFLLNNLKKCPRLLHLSISYPYHSLSKLMELYSAMSSILDFHIFVNMSLDLYDTFQKKHLSCPQYADPPKNTGFYYVRFEETFDSWKGMLNISTFISMTTHEKIEIL